MPRLELSEQSAGMPGAALYFFQRLPAAFELRVVIRAFARSLDLDLHAAFFAF